MTKPSMTPAQAAVHLKTTKTKLATLDPALQRDVRRMQRFNGGAIISEARKQHTIHHRPQRGAMLRKVRTF